MVEAMPLHALGILRRPELDSRFSAAWEMPTGVIMYLPHCKHLMRRYPDGAFDLIWPEERDEQTAG